MKNRGILYLLITAYVITILVFMGFVSFRHFTLRDEIRDKGAQIEALLEGFYDIRTFAEANPYGSIQINITDPNARPYTLVDAMTLVQGQYDSFTMHIAVLIAIFTIAFTIFSIAMPIMNYVFVQKDVIASLREEQDEMKGDFKAKLSGLENVIQEQEKMKGDFEAKLLRLEKSIEQVGQVTEVVAAETSNKQVEPSERDRQVDIEPISEANADKAHAFCLRAITAKDPELALSNMNEAIKLAPENARYRNYLGDILYKMQRYPEALIEKQKTANSEPANAKYRDSLGIVLRKVGRYQEALVEVQEAVNLDSENAKYRDTLGIMLHEKGRYREALVERQKAVELEHENARYRHGLSVTLCELGRYQEALVEAQKAVDLELQNARYRNMLGAILYELKCYHKALVEVQKAVELESENAKYRNDLSVVLGKMKRYPEALVEVQKAVELNSEDARYNTNLGIALYRIQSFDKAIIQLGNALRMSPNPAIAYAHSYRGLTKVALEQMNDAPSFDEAKRDLDKAIELAPTKAPNYRNRAEAYILFGMYEEAKQDLAEAMRLDEKDPDTHFLFSILYNKLGDHEAASQHLSKAQALGYIEEPDTSTEQSPL